MKRLFFCLGMMQAMHGSYTAWKADQEYKKGNIAKARQLYQEAVIKHPGDMQSLYNVGVTAYKEKDYQAAAQAFEKVIKMEATLNR